MGTGFVSGILKDGAVVKVDDYLYYSNHVVFATGGYSNILNHKP